MKEAIRSYKAKELLGWEAKVSFKDGVQQCYDFLGKERIIPQA